MANAATAADHITLNQGEGGSVVATDFVNQEQMGYGSVPGGGPAHFQIIKLSTGGAGQFNLLSDTSPAPANIVSIGGDSVAAGFIAVRGNTAGTQAVPVSLSGATLEVNDITVIGGTIDQIQHGVSADIRGIKA